MASKRSSVRFKCPGQDWRELRPDDVREERCPNCGAHVEFFRDDLSRKCASCGTRFRNPAADLRCAKWCRYAKECIDYRPEEEDRPP